MVAGRATTGENGRRYCCTPNVRDAIRLVERDGWRLARTVDSHRQYRHPTKPGTVTIPGHGAKDLPPGTCTAS
jgi:predicted RNA binding protein YcfA (HicA-like mRNA interferase family)